MRLAVYTDYAYHRDGEDLFAERAFVLFLGELARHVDELVLVGRLAPEGKGEKSHYRVAPEITFEALPHYESLADPVSALKAARSSTRAFGSVLDRVDAVWLLGPHPLSLLFAAQAARRRVPVILGVRQNLPVYTRSRHPDRRVLHLAADVLEGAYRLLALRCPTVVVGPDLARRYRRGRSVLPISVSLVHETDLPSPEQLPDLDWDGRIELLSVGRLESEKNPLLLADIIAGLRSGGDDRWHLQICGEGDEAEPLRRRLEQLNATAGATFLGYLPIDGGLQDLYRSSHAFLHVSWTEGVPQVLFESYAAGLPIVATAVGGVADAVGDDALLIEPGDAGAAVAALQRLAREPDLRRDLARRGLERVRRHTLEAECSAVSGFIARTVAK